MSDPVSRSVLRSHALFVRAAVAALCVVLATAPMPAFSQAAQSKEKFGKGLLWRVSKRGSHPSFVFGTIHVADPRVVDVPEAVGRVLLQSRYYYVESVQDEHEAARFFGAAQFEDGRGLEPLIGAEAYARAAEMLRAREVPDDMIARIRPSALLVNLAEMPGDYDYERVTLDQNLLELAREKGLRVVALENIREQIAELDGMPLETQIELLRHALAHRDELAALVEPAIEAWLRRDLAGVHAAKERIATRYPQMAGAYRALFRAIVEHRSAAMANRLIIPLREGGAFIAVGADHLYGADGLLSLIERRGYRVERIY